MRKALLQALMACVMICVIHIDYACAFGGRNLHLTYAETAGEAVTSKEYLIEETGRGYRLTLFNQGVKRVIYCDDKLDTYREEYHNPSTGDRLTIQREGELLVLRGTLEGKEIDKSYDDEGVWYGSVLLLKNFALSGEKEVLFLVTKPEEERVIELKAIREDVEIIHVGGQQVEAVRIKYTVPGFRGAFWKSYYWYRTSDGLLVKTDEVRGGPGTPDVQAELIDERELNAIPGVAMLTQN